MLRSCTRVASYFIWCVDLNGDYVGMMMQLGGISPHSWCFIHVPQQLAFFISLPLKTRLRLLFVLRLLPCGMFTFSTCSSLHSHTDSNLHLHSQNKEIKNPLMFKVAIMLFLMYKSERGHLLFSDFTVLVYSHRSHHIVSDCSRLLFSAQYKPSVHIHTACSAANSRQTRWETGCWTFSSERARCCPQMLVKTKTESGIWS